MKKINLIKLLRLRYLALIFGLAVVFFQLNTQEASAVVQKKMPYQINVNRAHNTITIYELDDVGRYTVPVKAMICSVGLNNLTPTGTFQTKAKYRWKALMGNVWGQYSTRIVGGILFHSVYYYKNGNPATLATKEYNKLGLSASHGCIRLTVEDAKWIYDNCKVGTTVVIADDADAAGPLGKPVAIKLPGAVRWDPTDPDDKNPYKDTLPVIKGAKDIKVAWSGKIDYLEGITAKSSVGENITSSISVEGEVDTYVPGVNEVIYSVTDSLGRTVQKAIKVTVKENPKELKFTGIVDKIESEKTIIDTEYALKGVNAYLSDIKLENDRIDVSIDILREDLYDIAYSVTVEKKYKVVKHARITIDRKAPVFTGISDRLLEPEAIPDVTYALDGISVSDNYSVLLQSDIMVILTENSDGNYKALYQAEDEYGNISKAEAIFSY